MDNDRKQAKILFDGIDIMATDALTGEEVDTRFHEATNIDSFLYRAISGNNEPSVEYDGRLAMYSWSLGDAPPTQIESIETGNALTEPVCPIRGSTTLDLRDFQNAVTTIYRTDSEYIPDQWIALASPTNDDEYNDDYDDLPEWLRDALCSLEVDGVVPEWELVYLTNKRFVHIDDDTVATDEHQFDTFECGYHEPTSALYVRVYDMPESPASNGDKPFSVMCSTCNCTISTYGLVGDVVTCEHCGQSNSVYTRDDDKPVDEPKPANQTNGRYGMWMPFVMP